MPNVTTGTSKNAGIVMVVTEVLETALLYCTQLSASKSPRTVQTLFLNVRGHNLSEKCQHAEEDIVNNDQSVS